MPGLPTALFRILLRAYPASFRGRFGREMEDAFADAWREHEGIEWGRRAAFLVRTYIDVGMAGTTERLVRLRRWAGVGGRSQEDLEGRKTGMGGMIEAFVQDLRFGVRSLSRRPGFTAVAVSTLAMGIGANSAIFSVVDGVLLRPLPYPDSQELVTVEVRWRGSGATGPMSYPDLADLEAGSGALESLVGYSLGRFTLTGLGEPRIVETAQLTAGLLSTFRLTPALGRDIRRDEFGTNAARVAVVGHAFWRRNFGDGTEVTRRTIELDGVSYEVVGVAPEGFDFPEGAQIWIPRQINVEVCARGCHTWQTVGRLRPGATPEAAQAALDRIGAALRRARPETNANTSFSIATLQDHMVGQVRRGLWLLLGAVGFVLLIACANVANLLLVRASSRTGEVAVRSALGASRGRLRQQVLGESALLATIGGGLGVGLAYGAVGLLARVSPGTIPRIDQVAVDGTVLLFTVGLVLVVTLAFGLVPILQPGSSSLGERLARSGPRGGSGGHDRSRGTLLAVEVALSLVLLVGAGLLLRTLGSLRAVDLGFEAREVVRFSLNLPEARYGELSEVRAFYRTLEERVRALPGVEDVGSVYGAPFGNVGSTGDVMVEGRPDPPPGQAPGAAIRSVTPGYLPTLQIPLVRGRLLESSDDADAEPVAVVNQRFVDRVFPGEDPIGRSVRVTVDHGFGSPYWRIVGVVGDVRSSSLRREAYPEVYVPQGRFGPGYMTVNVRGIPGGSPLLPALRAEVRSVDPDLPLIGPEAVTEVVGEQMAPTRFYLGLVVLFACVAVALAGVGLYGVVSYLVSRRTREIGLRVALGANPVEITRMVVGQGLRPAAVGIVVGLVLAFAATGLLDSLLYGVAPHDPWIFAGVSAFLAVLVLLASWLPARRAMRIDPIEALRVE